MQHLSDDLLFDKREQRSVFLGGGRFADSLEEDRQQLLLICQCENGIPIDVFHDQIGSGNAVLDNMQKLCFGGRQGHVSVPSPFLDFFNGMSKKQRC